MDKKTELIARKARWSWYSYDFGNSAYASVVLLAVYSAFFKNVVVGGAEGTRLWGISVGVAAIIVALISPVLGTVADLTRSKKKFLLLFTVMSATFTALLFFVGKGDVLAGMGLFILAEVGYRAAQVFYDSLLVEVSTPETVGSVSGKGWATGMMGGVVALLLVLLPIQVIGNEMIPLSFLMTAVLYLIFSIPTFLWVKEEHDQENLTIKENLILLAFSKLKQTFQSIRDYREFIKYTIAYLIYNDGIMMLMDFAAIIGATLYGMEQIQLILFVILIHVFGTFGALLFGRIADKKSSKDAILVSLVALTGSVSLLYFISEIKWFYLVGILAGFFLTGAQAISRAMVSQLAPPSKTAEFYGFLSVAGRTSTFVGPLVFSTISYRAHNWYVNHGFESTLAEQYGLLWAIGSILAFLLTGMILLIFVKRITK